MARRARSPRRAPRSRGRRGPSAAPRQPAGRPRATALRAAPASASRRRRAAPARSARSAFSCRFAQEALVAALRVGGEAVRGERFLDGVVEHADLADLARFLAGRHFAAELAADAHELLDLLD